jgi:hypothetical protein
MKIRDFFIKYKVYIALSLIILLGIILRFYQLFYISGFLQFDIFHWMFRSSNTLINQATYTTPYDTFVLWGFFLFNSIISLITGLSVPNVYFIFGSLLSSITIMILFVSVKSIFKSSKIALIGAFLFAISSLIVPRSIMYLPETLTYLIGPIIIFLIAGLIRNRSISYLILLIIFNIFYIFLHQGAILFIFLTVLATLFVFLKNREFYLTENRPVKTKKIFFVFIFVFFLVALLFGGTVIKTILLVLSSGSTGNAVGVPEPISKIVSTLTPILILFSIFGIITGYRRSEDYNEKAIKVVLLVLLFSFSLFLYIFPTLGLFNLIPWRFYTWTFLYLLFFSSAGFFYVGSNFKKTFRIGILFLFLVLLLFSLIPSNLIYDDSITSNPSTLNSMYNSIYTIPQGSIIITSKADFSPAKFVYGNVDVILPSNSSQVFLSYGQDKFKWINDTLFSREKYSGEDEYLDSNLENREIYILISKFQLMQKPVKYAWWVNNAYPQTNPDSFSKPFFNKTFEDENIVLFKKI